MLLPETQSSRSAPSVRPVLLPTEPPTPRPDTREEPTVPDGLSRGAEVLLVVYVVLCALLLVVVGLRW